LIRTDCLHQHPLFNSCGIYYGQAIFNSVLVISV
jgi:hypothetical protein